MKKINIATLWNAHNYGAFLQAYALSSFCISLGYDVYMLRECSERRSYFSEISRDLKKFLYQIRLHRSIISAQQNFKLSNTQVPVYATIVGADEVWNVNNHHFHHIPAYIGKDIISDIIISYAPSSNGVSEENFVIRYGQSPFSEFDVISVRDVSTKMLVESLNKNSSATLVLDPTFLLDDYNSILEEVNYSNYVFIYGYGFSEKEKIEIKKFAAEQNKILISAGPYHNWTDLQIPGGPGTFLGLIKSADFVITSTFHGTVFSIIFNKQFASYCRENQKVLEILDTFNLQSRNTSVCNLFNVLSEDLDYYSINQMILKKKESSRNFLINALTNSLQ